MEEVGVWMFNIKKRRSLAGASSNIIKLYENFLF